MLPSKSSLARDDKPSPHMTVTFQIDDTNQSDKEMSTKRQTRKKAAESFVHQEIQSWSSFFGSSNTKEAVDRDSQKECLQQVSVDDQSLLSNGEHSNRYRSALIGRKKQQYHHHNKLTRHSLFGTMSDINQILMGKHFLRRLSYLKTLIIFIDSCFRGIGQVVFVNNPLSGLIITMGLLIGQWQLTLYGLLGTVISTSTAHLLGLDYGSIRAGLYGYNGCLTAMAVTHFSYNPDIMRMIGSVVLMSACSTIVFCAISKILLTHFGLSPFTFSSQICSFLWLLAAQKFQNFSVNETLFTPGFFMAIAERSSLSNETIEQHPIVNLFTGLFTSVSEVYLVDSVVAGIIILVGISICSPILTILALFGAAIGELSAGYLFGLHAAETHKGLWGYNSMLTCQALGGMFFLLNRYHTWLFTFLGCIMTVVAQAAISILFLPIGLSPMLLPSTLICWLFCLMAGSTKNMIAVELQFISTPEDHLRRCRLTRVVKMQIKFMENLPAILQKTGRYGDISMEDLPKIEAELVPILLCSYTHQNERLMLKTLLHKGASVNSTDYDLRSPLHIAACDGNAELCLWLIVEFRANTNMIDDFGGTPLYDAFSHGNFHLVPLLYAHGARMPASKTKELTFYLCAFSFEGNLGAVQYLLACGVNPNLADYDGRTALHLAVCGNHLPIVKYLVEIANASVSIVDSYGQTPIDDAQHLPNNDIASYFRHRLNSSLRHKRSNTIIQVKNITDDIDSDTDDEEDDNDIVDMSSMNIEDNLLPAIFCMSAAEGNIRQMASILQQFPEFRADSVDYDFRSAAHVAAAEGQLLSIRFLYDYCYSKKIDLYWINREDRWGCTPIEEAYRHGHYGVANYLEERITKSPESISLDIDQSELSTSDEFMISMRKWKKILHFATLALNNEAELIKGLLDSKVFSSSQLYADYDGRTPMHLAAANGHLEVVKVLQFYGDNGKTHKDRWGNCALDEARRKKFDHIVDILSEDIV